MLAGFDDEDSARPSDAEVNELLGKNFSTPSPVVESAPPPVAEPLPPPAEPVQPPAPKIGPTPEELERLTALADSQRRGRRMALMEVAITRCGDHFSLHDVMNVLKREFNWRGTKEMQDDLASAFWKAVRRRGYILIKAGAGRAASIYGKTPPSAAVSP